MVYFEAFRVDLEPFSIENDATLKQRKSIKAKRLCDAKKEMWCIFYVHIKETHSNLNFMFNEHNLKI